MEEVYLDILSPVLAEIGASWARGEIDISVGSLMGLCAALLGILTATSRADA